MTMHVRRPRAAAGLLGAAALLTAACQPGDAATGPTECAIWKIEVTPADTALTLGESFTYGVETEGNCTARLRFSVDSDAAEIDSLTGRITARGPGRAEVTVSAQGSYTRVPLSLVPEGLLASPVVDPVTGYGLEFHLFRTDLSGRQVHEFGVHPESSPDWHPSGSRVVVSGSRGGVSTLLFELARDGSVRALLPDLDPERRHTHPQYSADGEWIYFTREPYWDDRESWRVRRDGTGLERVGPTEYEQTFKPAPSPDGRLMAYLRMEWHEDPNGRTRAAIWDLEAGAHVPGWGDGSGYKFSPDGAAVAFESQGGIYVQAFPLSGGPRRVGDPLARYGHWTSWSSDGAWLAVYSESEHRVELIRVDTGLAVPLPNTRGATQPAWAPASAADGG